MFDVVVCGSLNIDLLVRVTQLPRPGETVSGQSLRRLPGGKGLNQAIAARRLGARTAMIGAVGGDADGTALIALLTREGLDATRVRQHRDVHTGLAHVMVADDGENAIVVHSAANATLTDQDVIANWPSAHVALVQLETPIETVAAFLKSARAHGLRSVFNTAPAISGSRALLALADIVVMNETELAHYTAMNTADEISLEACVEHARSLLVDAQHTVIVTLGARGALVVTRADDAYHPAPQVTVVDTTGAGDCFCGALAAKLAQGCTTHHAVDYAVRAASIAVTREGASPAMPRTEEIP